MTGKLHGEEAERERDQLRGEVAQLLIERAGLRAENMNQHYELDSIRSELIDLREELANRNAEIEGLESARAGDDMAIDMLKAENERLRAALERIDHDSRQPATANGHLGFLARQALGEHKRA